MEGSYRADSEISLGVMSNAARVKLGDWMLGVMQDESVESLKQCVKKKRANNDLRSGHVLTGPAWRSQYLKRWNQECFVNIWKRPYI